MSNSSSRTRIRPPPFAPSTPPARSPEPSSAIVPVILGTNEDALAASRSLLDAGLLVPAIRYPTVPRNSARLRITISAAHDEADIDVLATTINSL